MSDEGSNTSEGEASSPDTKTSTSTPSQPDFHNMSQQELVTKAFGENFVEKLTESITQSVTAKINQKPALSEKEKIAEWVQDPNNLTALRAGAKVANKPLVDLELEIKNGKVDFEDIQIYARHGKEAVEKEPDLFIDAGSGPDQSVTPEQAEALMEQIFNEKGDILSETLHPEHKDTMARYQRLARIVGEDPYGFGASSS